MNQTSNTAAVGKAPTGIPGLDSVARGGLPLGRTTMISGTAGSGKTIFGAQFLLGGIEAGNEPGVLVTCEERPVDLRQNLAGFGWNVADLEARGLLGIVDLSPEPTEQMTAGTFDLEGLLTRITAMVRRLGATRLVIDSLGAMFSQFRESGLVRWELFRIAAALREEGVTTLLTVERDAEYGEVSRYGVEEFVTDNVIVLRNVLEWENRRRTVEILKMRGVEHQKGEFPFTIRPQDGITVIPLASARLTQQSSDTRATSGNSRLDEMCSGGFFRDSVVLVSGATGTGKTLMANEFIAGGLRAGERCLFFGFEESQEQIFRNARGWGIDLETKANEGLSHVTCAYPETMGLEDHLVAMKEHIEAFRPERLVVDSVSALERVATPRAFREFIIALSAFIKERRIMGLYTAATPTLMGGSSVTEAHISTMTDTIILLRYVEADSAVHRALTILKMRGCAHDKDIRRFTVDGSGMHIGDPFRGVEGILEGRPVHVTTGGEGEANP